MLTSISIACLALAGIIGGINVFLLKRRIDQIERRIGGAK